MHRFKYRNNQLYCEGLRVERIARRVGTPLYIYSLNTVLDHYRKLRSAFGRFRPLICFSMKSNSSLAICKVLAKEGAGFDIVSGGELYKALKINANPRKIVYASVGKTDGEIRYALRSGILLFNVESLPELERIDEICRVSRRRAKVSIRVNPDVDASTHRYITTGRRRDKFGIDFASTKRIFANAHRFLNVEIAGLHIHIGSQITSRAPFVSALRRLKDFVDDLKASGFNLGYVNIGGGMGIVYKDEKAQTAAELARALGPILKKIGCKLILEPGRFIVGNAGILVTEVLYIKSTYRKKFVVVDAGMNDLIRPALYNAYHQILPLRTTNCELRITEKVDIVGPVCESGDFLAKERNIQPVSSGDLLAVMGAGAYGFSMASNYNARRRPAEVLVSGRRFSVIREREKYSDLIRGEKIR